MGDRCFMRIRIGGVITREGIDALLKANYSVTINLEDIEAAIANGCHLEVEADEVNWGNVDDIKAACFEHKLAFHIYNGDGGSYGSGGRIPCSAGASSCRGRTRARSAGSRRTASP